MDGKLRERFYGDSTSDYIENSCRLLASGGWLKTSTHALSIQPWNISVAPIWRNNTLVGTPEMLHWLNADR